MWYVCFASYLMGLVCFWCFCFTNCKEVPCVSYFYSILPLATLFGQIWRLEPLPSEKRLMWRREMEWLLCVSDYIVELTPSWQTFPDGTKLEVNMFIEHL